MSSTAKSIAMDQQMTPLPSDIKSAMLSIATSQAKSLASLDRLIQRLLTSGISRKSSLHRQSLIQPLSKKIHQSHVSLQYLQHLNSSLTPTSVINVPDQCPCTACRE